MPFMVEDSGGPRKLFNWSGSGYPMGMASFGERSTHWKYRDFLPWAVQGWLNQSICHLGCGLGWAKVQSYLPDGTSVLDDTLPWAVQKQLNQSVCHLGSGLWWAEGSTSSVVFARWRQCFLNTTEPSMCGGDAACCEITLTTCYLHFRLKLILKIYTPQNEILGTPLQVCLKSSRWNGSGGVELLGECDRRRTRRLGSE